MKIWIISLFASMMLLSGCSSKESQTNAKPASMSEVKVAYLTPEENPNKPSLLFQVEVTQDGKAVEDASSVQFEYWKSGMKEQSKMVEAKHVGKGVYEAQAQVEKNHIYYAYAHTEARGLHVMPKGKFIIGKPNLKKVQEE